MAQRFPFQGTLLSRSDAECVFQENRCQRRASCNRTSSREGGWHQAFGREFGLEVQWFALALRASLHAASSIMRKSSSMDTRTCRSHMGAACLIKKSTFSKAQLCLALCAREFLIWDGDSSYSNCCVNMYFINNYGILNWSWIVGIIISKPTFFVWKEHTNVMRVRIPTNSYRSVYFNPIQYLVFIVCSTFSVFIVCKQHT